MKTTEIISTVKNCYENNACIVSVKKQYVNVIFNNGYACETLKNRIAEYKSMVYDNTYILNYYILKIECIK